MVILMAVLVFKFPTGMVSYLFKRMIAGETISRAQMQLVPFKTIVDYVSQVHSLTDWFIKNLLCNIIMFVPFGILFPVVNKNSQRDIKQSNNRKTVIVTLVRGMCLSVAIEIFQYITCLGQCDIDDVILNTLGVFIGLMLLIFGERMVKRKG